jgi:hypothetical protein
MAPKPQRGFRDGDSAWRSLHTFRGEQSVDKPEVWRLVKEELDRVTRGESPTIAREELAALLLLLLRQEPEVDRTAPPTPPR